MAGTIVLDAITDGTGNTVSGSAVVKGSAKAWVNFNGTDGAIRSSFNVSSITRSGSGSYIVNMTTALPSANYSIALSGQGQSSVSLGCNMAAYTSYASAALVAPTTTTFAFTTWLYNYSSTFDPAIVNAAVFSS